MLIFVARRVLAVVPVLFGVTLAVFSMLFLVPGDPVKMMLAEFVTNPDQIAQMRAQLHLDEPILQQYGRFVGNAVRGDLGTSIRSRRPVATEIAENVGSTAQLALASMAVAIGLGIPLGLVAALGRNSWLDVAAMVVALLGVAMPSFWLGLLLIFGFSLRVLPHFLGLRDTKVWAANTAFCCLSIRDCGSGIGSGGCATACCVSA